MQTANLTGNVWKSYVLRACTGAAQGFLVPVYVLYLLGVGFTMADVGLFLSIISVTVLIAEIPTGIMADKFSRKGSVLISRLLTTASIAAIITADEFAGQACAWVLWGLGRAFDSGALSALIYDSLKAEGEEERFQLVYSNGLSVYTALLVVGSVLCGLLVDAFDVTVPLWCGVGAYLTSALIVGLMVEPPFKEHNGRAGATSLTQQVSEYALHLKESLRIIRTSAALLTLVVVQAIIYVPVLILLHLFAQPYLAGFAYTPERISYVYTLLYVVQAITTKCSVTFKNLLGQSERRILAAISLFTITSVAFIAHALSGLMVVVALAGARLVVGFLGPTLQDSLNRRLPSEQRASCLSLASMSEGMLGVLCIPLFGYLADVYSLQQSAQILEWVFVPLLLGTLVAGPALSDGSSASVNNEKYLP